MRDRNRKSFLLKNGFLSWRPRFHYGNSSVTSFARVGRENKPGFFQRKENLHPVLHLLSPDVALSLIHSTPTAIFIFFRDTTPARMSMVHFRCKGIMGCRETQIVDAFAKDILYRQGVQAGGVIYY